ncbi:MAG: hypothetical protein E7172_04385 [Firmicutes bacterium]|nr:hypothetical protein [Bacillota bacterium]
MEITSAKALKKALRTLRIDSKGKTIKLKKNIEEITNSINDLLKFKKPNYKKITKLVIIKDEKVTNLKIEETFMNLLQIFIDSFNSNKAKEVLTDDLFFPFVSVLKILVKKNLIDIKIMSECLGMIISFNALNLEQDLYFDLAKYYNLDGTFKYNEDLETFKKLLTIILIENSNDEYLINEFIKLLIKSNEENMQEIEKIKNENLIKLENFYKNNQLIKIPNDLNEFMELMDLCLLDENEKKYILKLISKQINEMQKYSLNEEEIILKKK